MQKLSKAAANIARSILTASLTATLVVQYVDVRQRRNVAHLDVRMASLKVAADLQDFAERCSDLVYVYDSLSPQARLHRQWHLPTLPAWQIDDRLRALPTNTIDRLWRMHFEHRSGADYIVSAVYHGALTDVAESVRDEAALLGLRAWKLSQRIRQEQGYSPTLIENDYGAAMEPPAALAVEKFKANHGPLPFVD